jgi:hypothetical protein
LGIENESSSKPKVPSLEIMEELKIGLIIPRWEGNKE